jgi:prolyl oligopeptidase
MIPIRGIHCLLELDRYFATGLIDNYRHMEDFNDPTVQQWVRATADYTIETLSQLPQRQAFFDRMKELDASVPTEVYGIMQLANGNIFYLKIEPQDDVAKLYRKDNIDSTEILLVDPDRFGGETEWYATKYRHPYFQAHYTYPKYTRMDKGLRSY